MAIWVASHGRFATIQAEVTRTPAGNPHYRVTETGDLIKARRMNDPGNNCPGSSPDMAGDGQR